MKTLTVIKVFLLASLMSFFPLVHANNSASDQSTIESKDHMADTAITAKVKGVYVKEKLFGDKDISVTGVSVETKNGIVYLTGTVETQAQADNAVKYAKSVEGVTKVDSKLEVKPAS